MPKILALYGPNGANLAAAYYDRPARKLHVLEDTKDTPEWDLAVLGACSYEVLATLRDKRHSSFQSSLSHGAVRPRSHHHQHADRRRAPRKNPGILSVSRHIFLHRY